MADNESPLGRAHRIALDVLQQAEVAVRLWPHRYALDVPDQEIWNFAWEVLDTKMGGLVPSLFPTPTLDSALESVRNQLRNATTPPVQVGNVTGDSWHELVENLRLRLVGWGLANSDGVPPTNKSYSVPFEPALPQLTDADWANLYAQVKAEFDRAKTMVDATTPEASGNGGNVPIGFLGGVELADALGVHPKKRDAFFQQLGRKRKKLGDRNWKDVENAGPNEPKILYRVDATEVQNVAAKYKSA